jgi:hypothetical protein
MFTLIINVNTYKAFLIPSGPMSMTKDLLHRRGFAHSNYESRFLSLVL